MPLSTMMTSRQRAALRVASRRLRLEVPLDRLYQRLDVTARRGGIDRPNLRLLLAFSLRADSNCVDVGAHAGAVLRDIVRRSPQGRHVAYEPLPHLAERLAAEFPSVDVRNAAVGDEEGEFDFFHVVGEPEGSGLKPRDWEARGEVVRLRVSVERLDSALPEGFVPDLIKIDVEGAEGQVIAGGLETIARHKPIVVFEHGVGGSEQYRNTPERVS